MTFTEGSKVVWRDGQYGVYASTNRSKDRVFYQPCKFWVDGEGVERYSALFTADFVGFKEPSNWMFWRDSIHEAACKAIDEAKNIKERKEIDKNKKEEILSLAKQEATKCS